MSERRFKNSWLRLERATEHLAAFQAEWNALFQKDSLDTVVRYDKDSGWYIASVILTEATHGRITNNRLALVLGELAYQLRAALDGLIWDAITLAQNGTEPPSDANRVEFPIRKVSEFKDCAFLKFPFPDKLRNWLESIQVDSAVKPEGHPDRGLTGALEDIHNLARLDRHRRLRVIGAVPTSLKFGVVCEPPRKVVARQRLWCDVLAGQYEFLGFQVETTDGRPPDKVHLETHMSFEILFEDIPPLNDLPPGEHPQMLRDAVRYVIDRFEEGFV